MNKTKIIIMSAFALALITTIVWFVFNGSSNDKPKEQSGAGFIGRELGEVNQVDFDLKTPVAETGFFIGFDKNSFEVSLAEKERDNKTKTVVQEKKKYTYDSDTQIYSATRKEAGKAVASIDAKKLESLKERAQSLLKNGKKNEALKVQQEIRSIELKPRQEEATEADKLLKQSADVSNSDPIAKMRLENKSLILLGDYNYKVITWSDIKPDTRVEIYTQATKDKKIKVIAVIAY
jgi:hypothetical protein